MEKSRGVALILALLVLSVLTVLGSALLTTSAIGIWISDNYKTATQSLYIAEAGIDDARERLRRQAGTLTQLLNEAAGPDYQLLTADDVPLIPARPLLENGYYEVRLQNDPADGPASLTDTNDMLILVSTGWIGTSRKTVEVTVQKGAFPQSMEHPKLRTITGLESLVDSIIRNASETYTGSTMNDSGGPEDYRVVAVTGDLQLGPGTGYGLLLVGGELDITGDITWNGLILVIGQGVVRWSPGVTGSINGGIFVARTRTVSGALLSAPENIVFTITDPAQLKAANRPFPYNPVAIRER